MERIRYEKRSFVPLYFFIIGVLLRFFIGCYLKTPTIYWDELKYYDIARSISNGFGITVRNAPTNFQKILYSLVLSPLFAVCPARPETVPRDRELAALLIFAIAVIALFRSSNATDIYQSTLQYRLCRHSRGGGACAGERRIFRIRSRFKRRISYRLQKPLPGIS